MALVSSKVPASVCIGFPALYRECAWISWIVDVPTRLCSDFANLLGGSVACGCGMRNYMYFRIALYVRWINSRMDAFSRLDAFFLEHDVECGLESQ